MIFDARAVNWTILLSLWSLDLSFLGLLGDGGSLPEIIDLWHVVIIQPEVDAFFRTDLTWNDDYRNPFSPTFLGLSVSAASMLMIRF